MKTQYWKKKKKVIYIFGDDEELIMRFSIEVEMELLVRKA